MITIVNFSHPISSGYRPDIKDIVGEEYLVLEVKVHLDQSTPTLAEQISNIVSEAKAKAGGNLRNVDCISLPGLAIAAVLIIEEFRRAGYIPNILRFTRVPDALPPRFEAVEVVRLRQPRPDNWDDEGSFGV